MIELREVSIDSKAQPLRHTKYYLVFNKGIQVGKIYNKEVISDVELILSVYNTYKNMFVVEDILKGGFIVSGENNGEPINMRILM